MTSFFDSSRVDEEQPGDSGKAFFSFNGAPLFKNKTEPVGGLLFGDGSAKEENFFKTPSKKDDNSLDFGSAFLKPEGGLGDTEPTFLDPFSRTPPSKRQNQGPSPTPARQAPHTGDESAKKESNSDVLSSLQRLGDQDPRTFDPSNIPTSGRASSLLLLAWIKDSKGRTLFQRLAPISSPALSAEHPPRGKRRLAFRVLREAIVKGRKFLELQTWNPHASAKRVCPTITSGGMRRWRV